MEATMSMNLAILLTECNNIEEIVALEQAHEFDEFHKQIAFERKVEILGRFVEWGVENEALGLVADLTDGWTESQRSTLLGDWLDDSIFQQIYQSEDAIIDEWTNGLSNSQRETILEDWQDDSVFDEIFQTGQGDRKRTNSDESQPGPSKKVRENNFFTVKSVKQVRVKQFKTTGFDYKVQFHDMSALDLPDMLRQLHEVFESLLDRVLDGVPMTDQVRFLLQSPQLDTPISLPFMQRHRVTAERILAQCERVVQSNTDFKLDDSVSVNIIHTAIPQGGTGKKRCLINLQKHLENKRAIFRIKNSDNLCLARAIVVAKAKVDLDSEHDYIRDCRRPLQRHRAQELHEKAGVPEGSCGLNEVKAFQAYLTDYQLNIVSKEHQNTLIYSGPEAEKRIYLYSHDNHYDIITSMPGFLARKKYCHVCKKGYDKIEDHLCGDTCKLCYTQNCPIVNWVHCNDCNRFFKNSECFERHKASNGNSRSICASVVKCNECNLVVKRANKHPSNHNCGLVRCSICSKYVQPENHRCYMQPAVKRQTDVAESSGSNFLDGEVQVEGGTNENATGADSGYNQLLFFDFECTQEGEEHVPNLCVVHNESADEWLFSGPNTRDDFCEWLFQEQNIGSIVVAHNFQGYDGYFILQYLHKNGIVPELIMRGAKLITLYVPMLKIRFIDSLCFIPMKLADFPKTFGMTELAKGYFPHHFNTEANQNYIGPLPDVEFYDPDGMSPDDRKAFLAWHKNLSENSYVFNFQEDFLKYCRSDVDILRRCCLEFRELFRSITDIDPFEKCLTIASACNLVFRTNFLKEETIAVIPPHGFRPRDKQSIIALKWLAYTAENEGICIRHARNFGEERIGKYRVDGYDHDSQTVYEFHGCFWHGCIKCYSRDTIQPVSQVTMHDLHQRTLEKTRYLQSQGYNVIELWGCQLKRMIEHDPEMKAFFDNFEVSEPLEPRNSLYGGRTNASKLFHQCQEDEKVLYMDYTSLYPWSNKYCPYVLKYPEIITENFSEDVSEYFGLIKCVVVPPRGLFHPVLPYRAHGKLMFPLCKTCTDNLQQERCNHTDQERALEGTWVTLELIKALEKGYRLVKIHEVWHFPERSEDLFTDYIDTFLKIKQQASGFPKDCNTAEKRQQYVEEYLANEGIRLEPDKIEKNPGLRALAKLMLNSFWGKFAQRPNMAKVKLISDPGEYFDLLTSDEIEVSDVSFVSDDVIEVRYENTENFIDTNSKTNVVIAAFTTAHARLKLYSVLEQLEQRVLYYDTDSIIFTSKPGEWNPEIGDYLGQLTDELKGDFITTFVSGGPKNYAYETDTGETCCKIRGITLNFRALKSLNFNTVCDTVYLSLLCDTGYPISVDMPYKISRNTSTKQIITKRQKKQYRIVYNKRVISDNYFNTIPYGF